MITPKTTKAMEKTKNRNMATTESGCTKQVPLLELMMNVVSKDHESMQLAPAYAFEPKLKDVPKEELVSWFVASLAAAEEEQPLVRKCMDAYMVMRKKNKAEKSNQ